MNEKNPLEQDVQALRLAAQASDWDSCRNATQALLMRLPTHHAIRLARDFVARRRHQRAMASDPEAERLGRAAWLELADQLEAALRGG